MAKMIFSGPTACGKTLNIKNFIKNNKLDNNDTVVLFPWNEFGEFENVEFFKIDKNFDIKEFISTNIQNIENKTIIILLDPSFCKDCKKIFEYLTNLDCNVVIETQTLDYLDTKFFKRWGIVQQHLF